MSGNENNTDYLGYKAYAQTLWARIEQALEKDVFGRKPLGDDPLVVGIFGEWGAGKSTLLKLVEKEAKRVKEEKIEAHKKLDDKFDLLVPVFFQPWKYEHEPHLLIPLLLHILSELQSALKKSESTEGKMVHTAHQVADWASSQLAGSVSKLTSLFKDSKSALAVSAADPGTGALLAAANALAEHLKKQKKIAAKAANTVEWQDNGRDYYELHEVLRKITRPALYEPVLDGSKKHPRDFQVNFVIFIDDLDRCLPEKAVATLELIKTIFNLESFAFVLALDEEVVERGIGHRYQSYVLKDKKPEMPITGFEYLEKIVHLPFRLPALTRQQASAFLAQYERNNVAPGEPQSWWFAQPDAKDQEKIPKRMPSELPGASGASADPENLERRQAERGRQAEMQTLVLNAFDAYVPRKMVRLVELMHQIAAVRLKRGRPLGWEPGKAGDAQAVDVRVVLALAMVQLFQPDLYRFMRRRVGAFSQLLSSFAQERSQQKHALATAELSDVDLWRWVAAESALPHASETEKPQYHGKNAPDPIARIQRIKEISERNLAEQVRLPMVHLLTQYRATQRHPFDVLKLFKSLALSLEATQSDPARITIAPYLSLLAEADVAAEFGQGQAVHVELTTAPAQGEQADAEVDAAHEARPSFRALDVQKLFTELVSPQPSVQANLANSNQLVAGQVLDAESAKALAEKLSAWMTEKVSEKAEIDQRTAIYRSGLPYLAPYLSAKEGELFWRLLNAPEPQLSRRVQPFTNTVELKEAHEAAKLYVSLGQDKRFNSDVFHLAAPSRADWLENFVHIPETKDFELFSKKVVKILDEFYIAKHLTTVAQYAHFVREGYGELGADCPPWWDPVGWLWRNGQWDNKLKQSWAQEDIKRRPQALRNCPMRWEQQLQYGSNPVTCINWFEARAYSRWLGLQLNQSLSAMKPRFQVSLPTEAQWERAARAAAFGHVAPLNAQYPWAEAAEATEDVSLRANVAESKLGERSVVGLFPSSPVGLFDLSGNLWEWQNNLYHSDENEALRFLQGDLKRGADVESSDLLALRGGSWIFHADFARASFRNGIRPAYWDYNTGFRVGMSLASKDSEN